MQYIRYVIAFCLISLSNITVAYTRIKDITSFEGDRVNHLEGSGLVVGLDGTGDNIKNTAFTQKGVTDLLDKMGISVKGSELKTKNIAFVMVTADLPPFTKQGSKIDVKVSAMGDAKSIRNGILITTSLRGPDGAVYAVAQGKISIPEFYPVSDAVKTKSRVIETNGTITGGAIVEREIDFRLGNLSTIALLLRNADFTTAKIIADTINNNIGGGIAKAMDSTTVNVIIPNNHKNSIVQFLSDIELLKIEPDSKAKVVINEGTATVVIGEGVKIRPVAIAHGNIVINVGDRQYEKTLPKSPEAKQKSYMDGIDAQRGVGVGSFESSNLSDLVTGLNALGVFPRDIASILIAMENAGAIDGVIEIR